MLTGRALSGTSRSSMGIVNFGAVIAFEGLSGKVSRTGIRGRG